TTSRRSTRSRPPGLSPPRRKKYPPERRNPFESADERDERRPHAPLPSIGVPRRIEGLFPGKTMKIAIIGQQDFGKSVLEAFLARGDTVAGVFCAPEKEGGRPDPMKVAAQEKGLPVFQFASLRSPEATQAMKGLDVDLGVMAFVLQFAPQEFVNIPRHGTIQYH